MRALYAGAAVHYHKCALNVCLSGRKRWLLYPPERSMWSDVQIEHFAAKCCLDEVQHLQQAPGDVVLVPSGWGHGVINCATENVAIASEVNFCGIDSSGARRSWERVEMFH